MNTADESPYSYPVSRLFQFPEDELAVKRKPEVLDSEHESKRNKPIEPYAGAFLLSQDQQYVFPEDVLDVERLKSEALDERRDLHKIEQNTGFSLTNHPQAMFDGNFQLIRPGDFVYKAGDRLDLLVNLRESETRCPSIKVQVTGLLEHVQLAIPPKTGAYVYTVDILEYNPLCVPLRVRESIAEDGKEYTKDVKIQWILVCALPPSADCELYPRHPNDLNKSVDNVKAVKIVTLTPLKMR